MIPQVVADLLYYFRRPAEHGFAEGEEHDPRVSVVAASHLITLGRTLVSALFAYSWTGSRTNSTGVALCMCLGVPTSR